MSHASEEADWAWVGACAVSETVLHSLHRSIVGGASAFLRLFVGLAFQLLAAGRLHVVFAQDLMRRAFLVRARGLQSISMCLLSVLWRVASLLIEGRDHCVRPGVNGFLGAMEVNVGEEWVWVLFLAA